MTSKKLLKRALRIFLILISIPFIYLAFALILTYISVQKKVEPIGELKTVYLSTNGVHLDIIIPRKELDQELLNGLDTSQSVKYYSFGWGDENFYINTPTWGDLTFSNAFKALFLESSSLMHVTTKEKISTKWTKITIDKSNISLLNAYINNSFTKNKDGNIILLKNNGYTSKDNFYKGNGSYSCFKTCNSWANTAFKTSGLKACYWTPFDFGLLAKHQ